MNLVTLLTCMFNANPTRRAFEMKFFLGGGGSFRSARRLSTNVS